MLGLPPLLSATPTAEVPEAEPSKELIRELVEALREISEAEDRVCLRCDGEARVWADGKAHYQGHNGPLMACPACGGTGKEEVIDLREIARAALAKAGA